MADAAGHAQRDAKAGAVKTANGGMVKRPETTGTRGALDCFLPRIAASIGPSMQICGSLIALLVSIHVLRPESRPFTRKFLYLSYYKPERDVFQQGTDDVYFLLAWIVNFTALRAVVIDWLLVPLANGLGVSTKNHLRFAEQGWLVVYYGIFWCLGMFLWYNSEYWLSTDRLWTSWPSRDMSGTFKWYYLAQLSFWLQQIIVVNIEQRRRDYAQMFTHHIVTCLLILIAYSYRYYRVANVVLCLMDLVDLIFPIAKILKYVKYETVCNGVFGLFVLVWLLTRHVAYVILCYRISVDVPGPATMLYGCYDAGTSERLDVDAWPDLGSHLLWPFQDQQGTICLNPEVKWIFISMLLALQLLSVIWFGMIVRVIVKVLRGGSAEDNRSEGEESDEEVDAEGEKEKEKQKEKSGGFQIDNVNACVGSTSAVADPSRLTSNGAFANGSAASSSRRRREEGQNHGTRRRILDPEERKELLARIGCVKPPS